MPNATPARPENDGGDVIRIPRPDWLPAEKWAEIKAATLDHIHATIVALREDDGR